jgi:hypothetical protein
MKFPFAFKCSNCDEEHVSHFQAAFVLDTAGNWFFDLGEKKGWTGVTQEQYETLMDLLKQRTQLRCTNHLQAGVINPDSGQRVFASRAEVRANECTE